MYMSGWMDGEVGVVYSSSFLLMAHHDMMASNYYAMRIMRMVMPMPLIYPGFMSIDFPAMIFAAMIRGRNTI